jgi:S1-C subfamily serine protease
MGTGVAAHPDGYVLTAWHVVQGCSDIKVQFVDGSQSPAEVVAKAESHDLAVLKLRNPTPNWLGLSPEGTWMGERVFTIGFPAVQVLGLRQTLSEGVVSSTTGIKEVPDSLTTSVPIQPGNSGGPLIDHEGYIVGVIAASADAVTFYRETGVLPQSLSWAVKADAVRSLFNVPPPPPPTTGRRAAIERAAAATCWILAFPD